MKFIRWIIGTIVILGILYVILFQGLPMLLHPDLPSLALARRGFYVLLLAAVLCVIRIALGPTAADRTVAIDILGTLIVGFCAILSVPTGRGWYLDIGMAWALQSFIASLALAKYLEGRNLDD